MHCNDCIEDTYPRSDDPGSKKVTTASCVPKVLIVDAMALLQSMKKAPKAKTILDLQQAFIKRIESMMLNYREGRIVFDRYLDESLKNKTRQKRATTHTEFEIHPEMKLTMSL